MAVLAPHTGLQAVPAAAQRAVAAHPTGRRFAACRILKAGCPWGAATAATAAATSAATAAMAGACFSCRIAECPAQVPGQVKGGSLVASRVDE